MFLEAVEHLADGEIHRLYHATVHGVFLYETRLVQEHAVYGGMVEAMDLAVGKVLDGLKEHGLEDNTVVFFMSDNGGLSTSEGHPTSNLPLRGHARGGCWWGALRWWKGRRCRS